MSLEERRQRLSALLLRHMQEHNLSGRQLARRLGLSQTSVLSYIDGATYPGAESRAAIAAVLGYSPAELDAYLENVPLQPQKSVDEVLQEIRVMGQEDFERVAQAVWDRLMEGLRSS